MIYLDHNATTPIDERVLEAMQPYLSTFYGNPSSLYRLGRIARSAIEVAREQVAELVDAQDSQILFTSGGTEANNLALSTARQFSRISIAATEHPSIMAPAQHYFQDNHKLEIIPVDSDGIINADNMQQSIDQGSQFVSIMLANNETGVIQNIAPYTQQLRAKNCVVHTDAVQALGKIPVSFKTLGVHLMTISGHKIYGPKGSGALIYTKDLPIKPLLIGGAQEFGLRAGTENVAAIVGFGKAAELARVELAQRSAHLLKLRQLLEHELNSIPGARVFAQQAQRLPNTVQFGITGMDGEMLLMKLDQKAVAVSSGSACASGGLEPSPVLIAMGFNTAEAKSAVRISLGKSNTEQEIIQFITHLKNIVLTNY